MIELNDQNAAAYLGRPCTVRILGGGVSNTVLLAENGPERVVLKQSLGKLRVEQDWFSDRSRILREAAALRLLSGILPERAVPKILSEDPENYAFTMTAAPAHAETWKALLFRGVINEDTAGRIAAMLGTIICRTWNSAELAMTFGDQTVFEQLRLDPYYRTAASRHPDLAPELDRLLKNTSQRRMSLVHGDWSPKNFLVTGDSVMAIDFEVIHFGDPSFDAAFLLNHLLLKTYRLPQFRHAFSRAALTFWNVLRTYLPGGSEWFESAAIEHLGALLLARIDGKSPVEYVTEPDLKHTIRSRARQLIQDPPRSIEQVFA